MRNIFLTAVALVVLGCGKTNSEEPIAPKEGSYTGTVSVVNNGSSFDNENIQVDFKPAADGKTASIVLNQIRFVPTMPVTVDVTIPDVTVQADDKEIVLSCARVVPLAMGGEYPRYTVTDLKGKIVGNEMTFSLNFGDSPTSFRGTK